MVPVSGRCNVILAFEEAAVGDADLLEGYFEVLFEEDGVEEVPAVEAALGHLVVVVVVVVLEGVVNGVVGVAEVGGAVLVFDGSAVLLGCKAPGAAEVVFGSGAADGWVVLIAVDVEFHFAFAVPVAFEGGEGEVGADVLAFAFNVVEDDVVVGFFGNALAAPLGVEVTRILRDLGEAVVDLVEEGRDGLVALVFDGDAGVFMKRHREVAVEAAGRVDGDWDGVHLVRNAEAAAEEVAERAFDGWEFFVVPVHAEDQVAQDVAVAVAGAVGDGDPDVLDDALSVDFAEGYGLSCFDFRDARGAFAGWAEVTGCHAAFSFFSVPVFPVDRTGLAVSELENVL